MNKLLFFLTFLLVSQSFAFEKIDSTFQNIKNLKKDNIPIVDIRSPLQWETTGVIPKAYTIYFFDDNDQFDLNVFTAKMQYRGIDLSKPIAIIDSDNKKSMFAAPLLEDTMKLNIIVLDGGYNSLKTK